MKRSRGESPQRQENAAPLPVTRNIVHGAFSQMREYAALAGSIQSADYEYHSAFPAFTHLVQEQSDSLLSVMEHCFEFLPARRRPNLKEPKDRKHSRLTETKRTLVMEAIDSMLENADAVLDEARGKKLRGDDQLAITFGSEMGSAALMSVSTDSNVVQVSRVLRPQLTFKTPVDNSSSPFTPVYADREGVMHTGTPGVHPFEQEIKAFKPCAEQLRPGGEATSFLPVAGCPLVFVDTTDALQEMVQALLLVKEIAVDLEHHDFYSFLGFTCLMQISTRDTDYIVDCLKVREDMRLLAPVFLHTGILKVFHGAKEDVRWLQKDFSLFLINFFDTGIALQTLHMPHSLAFAVDHFCQIKLNKKYQTADWRVRPLPAEMVHYARQDTHYLLYIYDRLKAMLLNAESRASMGNLLLHVYASSKALSLELYEKPVLDPAHSFERALDRNLGGLSKAQRRVAQFVYNWRDAAAREVDDSPYAVLNQSSLLAIASKLPQTVKELFQCANPVSAVLRKDVTTLVEAIRAIVAEEEGLASSGSPYSHPPQREAGVHDGSERHIHMTRRQAMGVFRPMTGTFLSLSLARELHPSLTLKEETAVADAVPLQAQLQLAPPSPWLCELRKVARRLKERPKLNVPLPGSEILEKMLRRSQEEETLKRASHTAKLDKSNEKANGPEEDEESDAESLVADSPMQEEVKRGGQGEVIPSAEGAVALRQVYGTGAKNRRKANKEKKH